jgi:hypothetical protein
MLNNVNLNQKEENNIQVLIMYEIKYKEIYKFLG